MRPLITASRTYKDFTSILYSTSRILYAMGGIHRELSEGNWKLWDEIDNENYYYYNTCAIYSRPRYNPYDIFPESKPVRRIDDSITQEDIVIAKHVLIQKVLDNHGVQVKRGRAQCPIHHGEGYNFKVFPHSFKCFTCNESGDVIALLMKLESLNFVDAVKKLINY